MALPTLENEEHLTRSLTLGCELSCTTIHGETFRGNLIAQDEEAMLVVISILIATHCYRVICFSLLQLPWLVSPEEVPSETSPITSENRSVHIINLRNTSKLEVLNEPLTPPESYTHLPHLDIEKIKKRRDTNIAAKRKEMRSRGVNVSEQAQRLYDYISKT